MNYIISGKVIKGNVYGRKIGFPTINLNRRNFLKLEKKPVFGIYSGKVKLVSDTRCLTYRAGIVVGPLDKKNLPKIEAHLIDYKGNAYGKKAIFEINKFIRKFKKFKTEKELIKQIIKDIQICSQG